MKYFETHFDEYIAESNRVNYHPTLLRGAPSTPCNVIFYGPPGVGKYTQMLRWIQPFSPSKLKYEKKMSIDYEGKSYSFKISDVHYEVDMTLMGCNSKALWYDIYQHIVDIVQSHGVKSPDLHGSRDESNGREELLSRCPIGFIVCKNMHDIHGELLETFYSYMQQHSLPISLHFVFLTEHIGFLPDNLLNACKHIRVPRPTLSSYPPTTNLKSLKPTNPPMNPYLNHPHQLICNKLVQVMTSYPEAPTPPPLDQQRRRITKKRGKKTKDPHDLEDEYCCNKDNKDTVGKKKDTTVREFRLLEFRDLLYDILIYHINVYTCSYEVFCKMIRHQRATPETIDRYIQQAVNFFTLYNNNYRPIYHLERYFLGFIRGQ